MSLIGNLLVPMQEPWAVNKMNGMELYTWKGLQFSVLGKD